MIIVAAPSGAGKSSFVERISQEDNRLVDIITFTTRQMRRGESQGHPYHFVGEDEFQKLLKEGFFVEHARVHTSWYGTPLGQIETAWKNGKCVIMDVDVQGADTFRRKFPDSKSVFILPPSIDELRRRVVKRDGQTPTDLEVRMQNAQREIARSHEFDFRLVNDDFESSYRQFKKIIEELLGSR
jgi:guanylate kinase